MWVNLPTQSFYLVLLIVYSSISHIFWCKVFSVTYLGIRGCFVCRGSLYPSLMRYCHILMNLLVKQNILINGGLLAQLQAVHNIWTGHNYTPRLVEYIHCLASYCTQQVSQFTLNLFNKQSEEHTSYRVCYVTVVYSPIEPARLVRTTVMASPEEMVPIPHAAQPWTPELAPVYPRLAMELNTLMKNQRLILCCRLYCTRNSPVTSYTMAMATCTALITRHHWIWNHRWDSTILAMRLYCV